MPEHFLLRRSLNNYNMPAGATNSEAPSPGSTAFVALVLGIIGILLGLGFGTVTFVVVRPMQRDPTSVVEGILPLTRTYSSSHLL